jgi:hypothetical protein
MSVDDFATIMPPPVVPSETPLIDDWVTIEAQLGLTLPDDYKAFIQIYGSGQIEKFLWVFNPFSSNDNLNLTHQVVLQLKVYSEIGSFESLPYKLFPERSGLLPFGITDNGDVLFWQTSGSPNDWRVIVSEARAPKWEAFDLSMTKFLFEILSRKLVCEIFPDDFPGPSPAFEASH